MMSPPRSATLREYVLFVVITIARLSVELARADEEHRADAGVHHLLGDAAEDDLSEGSAPVSGHEDRVDVLLFRDFQDLLSGVSAEGHARLHGVPGGLERPGERS